MYKLVTTHGEHFCHSKWPPKSIFVILVCQTNSCLALRSKGWSKAKQYFSPEFPTNEAFLGDYYNALL